MSRGVHLIAVAAAVAALLAAADLAGWPPTDAAPYGSSRGPWAGTVVVSPWRRAVGTWTPAQITSATPLGWWEVIGGYAASVSVSGTAVISVPNQISGGQALTDGGVPTRRPALVTNAWGSGLHALRPDGTSDFLATASPVLTGAQWWVAACVRGPAQTVNTALAGQWSSGAPGRMGLAPDTGTTTTLARVFAVNSNNTVNQAPGHGVGPAVFGDGLTHVLVGASVAAVGSPQELRYRADGGMEYTGGGGTAAAVPAVGFGLHALSPSVGYSTADVGAVVTGIGVLGIDDWQRLEGYLAHRCGAQARLPANHPYRNAPP